MRSFVRMGVWEGGGGSQSNPYLQLSRVITDEAAVVMVG